MSLIPGFKCSVTATTSCWRSWFGCALCRNELAELEIETIQQREGRWVLTTSRARAGASVTIRHESLPAVITGAQNAGRTEMVAPCRFSTYESPDAAG
jgi:hypothetical protein